MIGRAATVHLVYAVYVGRASQGELRIFLDSLTNEQLIDRLNLALDGASLGIWDWDLRDDSVQFDRRWCEMLGLDVEQVPMALSTWSDRVHPDDIAGCHRDIAAYLAGNTPRYENIHRMRHASGAWIYVLDRGRVSGWDASGRAIRFTGTHFDCTASELAKRVIQEQQELLADMVRHLPTAVAMFDRDDQCLAASDEWRTIFGSATTRVRDLDVLPGWRDLIGRARCGETLSGEHDLVSVDGRRGFWRWSMRPWRAAGQLAGIIVSCEDVTRSTEDRVVRERESRLSALGMMAGGIAHEIRTPLQSLMINATLIGEALDASQGAGQALDAEFVRACADAIVATTQRIDRTLHALMILNRQSASDPLVDVDACEMVRSIAELSVARFEAAGIDLRVACPDQRVHVRGRSADIGQILINLLNNAFDAVAEGSTRWVEVAVLERQGERVLRVSDSGPGIPPELRDRLMSPFYTTKPVGKGSGLGLSLAKSLAQGMGAHLVHDALAAHTSFELRFSEETRA